MASRIASVHNGSSLFTGDAGSGESNIRRHIIENDLLEAIIQLPNNLFYNTGITTYIWLLVQPQSAAAQGKVQLIDASQLYRKLRKNLGDKNCEFAPEHIADHRRYLFKPSSRSSERWIKTMIAPVSPLRCSTTPISATTRSTSNAPIAAARSSAPNGWPPLRFEKSLREPMEHLWETHDEAVYDAGFSESNRPSRSWSGARNRASP